MPRELSSSEESAFSQYLSLGTPDEIRKQISNLRKESAKYRTKVGELEETAKSTQAVPEGGRILSKAEAETFSAFEALKTKPADVHATITERDKLKGDLAQRDRELTRDAAAKALGIEGKDLAPFAGADALTFEVRETEVEKNGKKEKAPVAFVKDTEGKEHTLESYGKEKWGRPFEALLTSPSQRTTEGNRYTVETGRSSRSTPSDPIAARIEKMKEQAAARPNPLLPKTT